MQGVLLIGGQPEDNSSGWADSFLANLRDAFEWTGLRAIHARISETDKFELHAALRVFADEDIPFFSVDINGRNTLANVPAFALVVDHPLAHAHLCQAGPLTVLGNIDAGHADIVGYSRAKSYFVPHGGPGGALAHPDEDRPVDVLFCGGISLDSSITASALIHGWGEVAQAIIGDAVEILGDSDTDPFLALKQAIEQRSLSIASIDRASFARMLSFLSVYTQCALRTSVLKKLHGLKVAVMGPVAPSVRAQLGEDFTYSGTCGFDSFLAQACRSKIILNVSHKFPRGSHERIWYGMAAGACVLTNRSEYVERYFADGESILLYEKDEVDGQRLRDLIETGETVGVAERAHPVYFRHHTWRNRAEHILTIMDAHFA